MAIKFWILFVISVLIFTKVCYAQEMQCWEGTVEVIRKGQSEKHKEARGGMPLYEKSDFKYNENINIKIHFYDENGKTKIVSKSIEGNIKTELKSYEEWRACCKKRLKPGKLPVEVCDQKSITKKDLIIESKLIDENLEFSASPYIDSRTNKYSFRLGIGGLLYKAIAHIKEQHESIEYKDCSQKTREDTRSNDLGFSRIHPLGGEYKGNVESRNSFSGKITVSGPTGELTYSEIYLPEVPGLKFETTYTWNVRRVPCECSAKIIFLKGEAKLNGMPVKEGTEFNLSGAIIEVGGGRSRVKIETKDGAVISIHQNTILDLRGLCKGIEEETKKPESKIIKVIKGAFHFILDKIDERPFLIKGGTATNGIRGNLDRDPILLASSNIFIRDSLLINTTSDKENIEPELEIDLEEVEKAEVALAYDYNPEKRYIFIKVIKGEIRLIYGGERKLKAGESFHKKWTAEARPSEFKNVDVIIEK